MSIVIQADGNAVIGEKRRHDQVIFGDINERSFPDIRVDSRPMDVNSRLLDHTAQRGVKVCRITGSNRLFFELGQFYPRN